MSVYDPEPKVPIGDSGRGFIIMGWLALISAMLLGLIVPPYMWIAGFMPAAFWGLVLGGILLLALGYHRAWRSRARDVQEERKVEKDDIEPRRAA